MDLNQITAIWIFQNNMLWISLKILCKTFWFSIIKFRQLNQHVISGIGAMEDNVVFNWIEKL